MGDEPQKPRNQSGAAVRRLTPLSSRQAITEGAKELEVDDFIDNHLWERPRTVPEMALPAEAKPPVRTLALQAVPMKAPSGAPPATSSDAPPAATHASSPPAAAVPSVHPPGFIRPVEAVGVAPPSLRPSLRPRPLVVPVSEAPRGQRRLWLLVIGIMAVAVGASLAVIMLFRNRPASAPKTEPSVQSTASVTPTPMPSPTAVRPSASASVAVSAPPPEPEPSAASSALPSAAPALVPSASAAPAAEVVSSAAGSLLSFQGALTVVSSVDADVVLQGQTVGRTNQRLVVRCGPKNVRLRDATGKWLTPGQPMRVACMQETSLTLQP
jgi:hypothetical protein